MIWWDVGTGGEHIARVTSWPAVLAVSRLFGERELYFAGYGLGMPMIGMVKNGREI